MLPANLSRANPMALSGTRASSSIATRRLLVGLLCLLHLQDTIYSLVSRVTGQPTGNDHAPMPMFYPHPHGQATTCGLVLP